jgi:uncharacterized protein YciW
MTDTLSELLYGMNEQQIAAFVDGLHDLREKVTNPGEQEQQAQKSKQNDGIKALNAEYNQALDELRQSGARGLAFAERKDELTRKYAARRAELEKEPPAPRPQLNAEQRAELRKEYRQKVDGVRGTGRWADVASLRIEYQDKGLSDKDFEK